MFVNIMQFPVIPEEKDMQFRQWFKQTNEQYANYPGFISRRLLKARKQGNYAALIEHESFETFMAMHTSPSQSEAFEQLKSIIEGGPTAQFFDVVEDEVENV